MKFYYDTTFHGIYYGDSKLIYRVFRVLGDWDILPFITPANGHFVQLDINHLPSEVKYKYKRVLDQFFKSDIVVNEFKKQFYSELLGEQ